jgi:hypothetical protein
MDIRMYGATIKIKKSKDILCHDIKVRKRAEVKLHSFLNWTMDEAEWQVLPHCHFIPRNKTFGTH